MRPSLLLLTFLGIAIPAAASAQVPDRAVEDPDGTFTFLIENDALAYPRTDRYYSNGFQFSWLAPPEPIPSWMVPAGDLLEDFLDRDGRWRWGLALGQNIYTPEDTTLRVPDPRDRPYAGWLYGAASLVSYTPEAMNTLEVHLGVVGPAALGEQVQNNFHDLIRDRRARGWDRQLKNEPGIVVMAERKWRAEQLLSLSDRFGVDVTPHVALALGNVQTYASGGLMFRFGQNLASDFGAPRIRPSLGGSAFVDSNTDWAWYLFAGVEGRAVARDIFLDGNTFVDSPSVNKKALVGDLQAGFAVVVDGVRFTYTYVFRSEEFEGQDDAAQFGAFSVSFPL